MNQTMNEPISLVQATESLIETLKNHKPDTDFGLWGVISRMNTSFQELKRLHGEGRRKRNNKKVKVILEQIAVDSVTAQTLL